MPDTAPSVQVDMQNVVQRTALHLGQQVGQLSAELAAANEALDVQQKLIVELTAKVNANAKAEKGDKG